MPNTLLSSRDGGPDAVGTPMRSGRLVLRCCLAAALVLGASGCKILKNEASDGQTAGNASTGAGFVEEGFNAETFVDKLWDDQLVPFFQNEADPAADVVAALQGGVDAAGAKFGHREKDEGSPWNFVIVGEGTITAANTESRASTVDVDLAPGDGTADLQLQIGPVIRGTSVRDAADFIRFGSVTNQIEFARISRAINDRIRDTILKDVPRDTLVGRHVEFRGAFTAPGAGELPLVTPLALGLED
ncbi:DUF2291 family protein [Consotaella aegiceratis]|uniref:DUF2291 family protein n=1 Tax=Consotaella aegiceratis TaxID=3097961 RepID=UPI002F4003E0